MSLFERLCEVYPLLGDKTPLFHEKRNISAVCRISLKGELLGTTLSEFTAAVPVTERSASRTFGIAPHPLFECRSYLLDDRKKRESYLSALCEWDCSPFSCREIHAVRLCAERGDFPDTLPEKGLCAFSAGGIPLWNNSRISALWVQFCLSQDSECEIHPRGMMKSAPSAKLISANSDGRLLFSKRISSLSEAVPTSRLDSAAAHRALAIILDRVGLEFDGYAFAGFTDAGELFSLAPLLFGRRNNRSFSGSRAVLLALTAVSEGRLSVAMHREISVAELLCAWQRSAECGGLLSEAEAAEDFAARKALQLLDRLLSIQVR